ncbi:hypothetical protein [Aquimarina sp. U1-2]|uniref:hypothetical protein n=1 Tax=Aquimarina sp. U1-2 TaxID=2823141 RepID=UPI001AECD3C5|nr:hypothetical protein [Aquimarina sp. U1-2]
MTAQTKFEKEHRTKAEHVPVGATAFIRQAFPDKKVKWYAEESQDGRTYEAKTCYSKIKHSIEFDPAGRLIDVERKVHFTSLKKHTQNHITSALDSLFEKYKIIKTQIQWKGNPEDLLQSIKKQEKNKLSYQRYELVLKAKKDNAFKMYEMLLDSIGTVEKFLEIKQRPTDNLEF